MSDPRRFGSTSEFRRRRHFFNGNLAIFDDMCPPRARGRRGLGIRHSESRIRRGIRRYLPGRGPAMVELG